MPFPDDTYKQNRLTWLAEIYRTYATDLQRYISSKVGEPFLAEDLTSMVFLKALRWLKEDQSKESVRGWLYATARTTIADYWQMQGQNAHQTCSFCGRSGSQVKRMFPAESGIGGPAPSSFIYNMCVEQFHAMLQ